MEEEKKSKPKGDEKIEDYQCAICLMLMVEPVDLACKHSFCHLCLIDLMDNSPGEVKCPMDRSPVPESFVLKINTDKQKKIQSLFPKEFEERMKATNEIKEKQKNQIKLKFLYGNKHE